MWSPDVEVVVEAVGDGGSDRELGSRKCIEHRLGKHVGGRVSDDEAPFVRLTGDDLEPSARLDGPVEVVLLPVDLYDHRRLGQPRADALGDFQTGHTGGEGVHRRIRKHAIDRICHGSGAPVV